MTVLEAETYPAIVGADVYTSLSTAGVEPLTVFVTEDIPGYGQLQRITDLFSLVSDFTFENGLRERITLLTQAGTPYCDSDFRVVHVLTDTTVGAVEVLHVQRFSTDQNIPSGEFLALKIQDPTLE
jgi:hypothetical protein